MHLLFATSIVPDGALASGYEIANAAIIAALRRAGVRVTVIGFTWPGKPPADPENTIVLGAVDVRTENASSLQKLAWLGKAMLSGLTFASVKLRVVSDSEVRAAIERAGPFDGYVLNSVQFAGAFEKLFDDRPSIFVAHNVEHRSARGECRGRRQPLPAPAVSPRGEAAQDRGGAALPPGALRLHAGRGRSRRTRRRLRRPLGGAAAGDHARRRRSRQSRAASTATRR